MHTELAASLRHLCDRCRGVVPFDESAMRRLVVSLEGDTRYPPTTFGEYYALASALFAGDHRAASRWFERLGRSRPMEVEQRTGPLKDVESCERSALYHRLLMGDTDLDLDILPPPDDVSREFEERYRRGIRLLERTVPELAEEIRAIVHEVVWVVGDPDRETQFDGGSSYRLWGALFLNAEHHPTEEAIVEVVAHESAHSLLFGFCIDEPLVYNDEDELFESPLREDARPMDGIYHATFVSARMHYAMSRVAESDLPSEKARARALEACEEDRRNFEAGYGVVAEHGDLSELGGGLMERAREYMDAAATPG
ncbi:MAG: HEXXH motif-containing putative peptide modification protein [Gemmatimonadota bacterium]|nr:HEXXH motif-containing putative peptide modification protein [Gemmatimonadota bacterium]